MNLATALWLVEIGRGLREGLYMFWETLWALALGLGISGAVQAFVTRDQMRRRLGDHRPLSLLRASGYGMASSSCSYAASAMTKSLVAKGADFVAALAFMIASTNLVIELGAVLVVLLGWQFAVGEFVGGPIMIGLLGLLGGLVLTPAAVAAARRHLGQAGPLPDPSCGPVEVPEAPASSWRTAAGWSDASRYALADFTMLRRELFAGYLVAGLLAATVPASWWGGLFLHGHGLLADVENVLVGPVIAIISWVCSVGNVPLAAALWNGGISFGGVIAFVFADLISMPLLLVYRRFYGASMTWRMLGLLYGVMALAGLATEGVFALFHAVPTHHPVVAATATPHWGPTAYLNIVAVVLAGWMWWMARRHAPADAGYALDPVCGMQVRTSEAPAWLRHEGESYYFCADRCRDRFAADPARFVRAEQRAGARSGGAALAESVPLTLGVRPRATAVDPICQMTVEVQTAAATRTREGETFYFCCEHCAETFDDQVPTPTTAVDPICQMTVEVQTAAATRTREGETFYFCCEHCAETFDSTPR